MSAYGVDGGDAEVGSAGGLADGGDAGHVTAGEDVLADKVGGVAVAVVFGVRADDCLKG